MWTFTKKEFSIIVTILLTVCMVFYLQSCEPTVPSLSSNTGQVTREQLQLELDNILATAKLRMIDLDRQDQVRNLITQNALLIVEEQPFNPVGLITGIAAIYGAMQAGSKTVQVVKNGVRKVKVNNA